MNDIISLGSTAAAATAAGYAVSPERAVIAAAAAAAAGILVFLIRRRGPGRGSGGSADERTRGEASREIPGQDPGKTHGQRQEEGS